VSRRLILEWPDAAPFKDRDGRPIRLLAVSDVLDPTLVEQRNRKAMGPIDLILGCGDLDCADLSFVADGFDAPLVYIHGNHDSEVRWAACKLTCPEALRSTAIHREAGLSIAGLTWPGARGLRAERSERKAWSQALRLATRHLGHEEPVIVISHVPPYGAGDIPGNGYHRGFRGYLWLMRRLAPPLWIHGHTPLAAASDWHISRGPTTLINATGAVVIELYAPGMLPAEDSDRAETVGAAAGRGS
jgi:predicted phosphodiesterase